LKFEIRILYNLTQPVIKWASTCHHNIIHRYNDVDVCIFVLRVITALGLKLLLITNRTIAEIKPHASVHTHEYTSYLCYTLQKYNAYYIVWHLSRHFNRYICHVIFEINKIIYIIKILLVVEIVKQNISNNDQLLVLLLLALIFFGLEIV